MPFQERLGGRHENYIPRAQFHSGVEENSKPITKKFTTTAGRIGSGEKRKKNNFAGRRKKIVPSIRGKQRRRRACLPQGGGQTKEEDHSAEREKTYVLPAPITLY